MENEVSNKMAIINDTRKPLAARLPLECPLSISVTTANVCNLKCEFCAISNKEHKRNKSFMELNDYKILINRIVESKWHLKQLVLVGLGEPLLNKNIVDFVKIAKSTNKIDKVHIVTNGTLLTHELSDKLIEAGIDVIRVSINGLSKEDYLKYTGVDVDFDELIDNLSYFYNHKNENTKLYIKIMDYQIENKEHIFEKIFKNISDVINVEYLTEMDVTKDYDEITNEYSKKGLKGFEKVDTKICPLPFYHIYCNADATISACCVAGPWYTPPALIIGDLHSDKLSDIWKSKSFNKFLIAMLEYGKNAADPVCSKCKAYLSYIYPEDVLDGKTQNIIKQLQIKMEG